MVWYPLLCVALPFLAIGRLAVMQVGSIPRRINKGIRFCTPAHRLAFSAEIEERSVAGQKNVPGERPENAKCFRVVFSDVGLGSGLFTKRWPGMLVLRTKMVGYDLRFSTALVVQVVQPLVWPGGRG
jgi:hypothetical protein